MALGRQQQGGYDCEFIEEPPESLCCRICFLPFREPQIVDCCGTKYCGPCLERWQSQRGSQCPSCRAEFQHLAEKSVERQVLSLRVYCSKKNDSCDWEGELRQLDEHHHTAHGTATVEGTGRRPRMHRHCKIIHQITAKIQPWIRRMDFWFWMWAIAFGVLLGAVILLLKWLNMSEEGEELKKSVVDLTNERDTLTKERDILAEERDTLNHLLQIIIWTGITISVALLSYCYCRFRN